MFALVDADWRQSTKLTADQVRSRFSVALTWIQWAAGELRSTRLASRILIGVLCAVLMGIGVALTQTISAHRRAQEQVEVTTQALSLLRQSLIAGIEAETGQRGFLLTEKPALLEPYERCSKTWLPTLAELRSTLEDSATPEEDAALARLEQLATAKLAIMQHALNLARAGARERARDMVATTGKRTMDDYRAIVNSLEGSQSASQRQAINEARAVEARAVPIIYLLGASILGLIIIGLWLERRTARAETAARDADELREAHARSDLLVRELNHRVKNLFAVVLSIVTLSGREGTDVKTTVANIRSRIYALSLAHAVSQGEAFGKVALRDLVSAILKPFENAQGRVKHEGENVELAAEAVTPLGLVLHELATNAAKYGALSVDGGLIEVRWNTQEGQSGRELELLWKECHGPVVAHERVAGFGSMLLQKASQQLDGPVRSGLAA